MIRNLQKSSDFDCTELLHVLFYYVREDRGDLGAFNRFWCQFEQAFDEVEEITHSELLDFLFRTIFAIINFFQVEDEELSQLGSFQFTVFQGHLGN